MFLDQKLYIKFIKNFKKELIKLILILILPQMKHTNIAQNRKIANINLNLGYNKWENLLMQSIKYLNEEVK